MTASRSESSSTPVSAALAAARASGRLAFMPFVTAGDPDLAATSALIGELGRRGVDLIEVGFPYSDPIADGPIIQASYTRALQRGLTIDALFDAQGRLPRDAGPPRVAMASYALMLRRGVDAFVAASQSAGFSAFIVPDLPGDEAADVFRIVRGRGLDLIQLIAPTTPRARVPQVLQQCSGFVYCLAVAGITGEREQLADALYDQLRWLREETSLPLAVGFGISRPEHVAPLRELADGVIVGSAIVKRFEQQLAKGAAVSDAVQSIGEFAVEMLAATRR